MTTNKPKTFAACDFSTGRSELKPCPFCGDKAKYYLAGNESLGYQPGVTCIKCLANVHGRFVEPSELGQEAEDVINRWNRRAEPEQPAIKEYLTTAEPVSQWIPVSERLPKPYEVVRFYPEIAVDPVIDRGYFDNEGRCWYNECIHGGIDIVRHERATHWQPITTPEEQSDE